MRTITGYRDGKAQWSENEPARGRVAWTGSVYGAQVTKNPPIPQAGPSSIDAMRKKAIHVRKQAT